MFFIKKKKKNKKAKQSKHILILDARFYEAVLRLNNLRICKFKTTGHLIKFAFYSPQLRLFLQFCPAQYGMAWESWFKPSSSYRNCCLHWFAWSFLNYFTTN